MEIFRKKKAVTKVLGMVFIAVILISLSLPLNVQAASITKKKLNGIYWDHKTKTADKQSYTIKYGKTYKLTLNKDKRHPGSYNGMVKFKLPKYGQYKITMSGLSGAKYVAHNLYKKYNYGIGYASYVSGKQIDLVSKKYYKTLTGNSKKSSRKGTANSYAILESGHQHYIYFMSDSKATFTFKITKAK